MLSLEQMIFCIQKVYPGTRQGSDYWVAHPVDASLQQSGPAFVVEWKLDQPQPTEEQIEAHWTAHGDEYRAMAADADGRAKRNALLVDADNLVEMAIDTGNAALETSARSYRQSLRDLPQREGWPNAISWPDPADAQPSIPQT
ncbi:phage tail assembly chaperone [Paraburkholderia lacunae]|uniref:Phage tail protein n=1 Tax=Paraburkholderia lacunae TaxID=2211104 RepID=A0A370N740_9BURK|nr:phage tail assembly chaperone [Paraburkholderia lacunae]RDK01430.1 hypothetical protein DLM46_16500 [Paraburkholderia lacunae]